ncbi:MAG: S8 family serine peptidase [Paracoccaceae bacterium]
MAFKWNEGRKQKSQEAWFRVNVLSRSIAKDLQTDPDNLWWLVVLDPQEQLSIAALVKLSQDLGLDGKLEDYLYVPGEYTQEQLEKPQDDPLTFYARRSYINAINDPDAYTGIERFEVGPAFRQNELLRSEEPFTLSNRTRVEVPEGSVVVAVIDNGMAIGHELFRRDHGAANPTSRIEFFWNMDGVDRDPTQLATGEELASIGNAWTREGIDKALADNMHFGLLDDQAFYNQLGATDWATRSHTPIARQVSHGTHVMGLAAGFQPDDSNGDKRPIIAVNLQSSDVQDPSGLLFASWLEQALRYIAKRHRRIFFEGTKKHPPIVINFSFGNYAGPHDGTGIIEEKIRKGMKAFDDSDVPHEIVLPDGNSNQRQCHARVGIDGPSDSVSLDWRVQPSDNSESSVEFWLDDLGTVPPDYVSMSVDGPGDVLPVTVSSDPLAPPQVLQSISGETAGTAYFVPAPNSNRRGHFKIQLFATDSIEDVGPFAPSGIWKLSFSITEPHALVGLKGWIVRDESLPGFPNFGRQSYFDQSSYTRFYEPGVDIDPLDKPLIGGLLGYDPLNFPSEVRRQGTISGFTGTDKPIVVGGFVDTTQRMALYSSTGPTNNPNREGPDASGRSDDSPVLTGVLSAGSASGSMVTLPGTSMSCPQVTRWVADQMEMGTASDRTATEAAGTAQDPDPATKPPIERSGGGRMVDLENLFGKLRVKDPSEFWRS